MKAVAICIELQITFTETANDTRTMLLHLQVDLDNAAVHSGSKVLDLLLLCQVLTNIKSEGVQRACPILHLLTHALGRKLPVGNDEVPALVEVKIKALLAQEGRSSRCKYMCCL